MTRPPIRPSAVEWSGDPGRTLRPGRRLTWLQRSAVVAPRAMVGASQTLAAQAGLQMLREGGTAADAAVAAAAVVSVAEPHMSGIGGDTAALYYDRASRRLHALNATGTAPARASVDALRRLGLTSLPDRGPHTVTVPGALAGWQALLTRFGRFPLGRVLEPAIAYAEDGLPIAEVAAAEWAAHARELSRDPAGASYLIDGRAPRAGEIFRNPNLAETYRRLGKEGPEYLYRGPLGARIAATVERHGGLLRPSDFPGYEARWVDPVSTTYRGVTVFQLPPNSQGIVVLEMLNILEGFDPATWRAAPTEFFHAYVEAKKLAFADRAEYLADPLATDVPAAALCSKALADDRRRLIGATAAREVRPSAIPRRADTSYLAAVDESRNVVSMMTSLFNSFGSGLVVEDTGVILHNRGRGFAVDATAANAIGPGRRPPHTLIPSVLFRGDSPWLAFGVVGGHQQAQGQVQVLANVLDFGMAIQDAVDAPRLAHMEGFGVHVDMTFPSELTEALIARGHDIDPTVYPHGILGRAQILAVDTATGALSGASDWRMDGLTVGY